VLFVLAFCFLSYKYFLFYVCLPIGLLQSN